MNASRRKTLAELLAELNANLSELQSLAVEEQSAFDNMPESLQLSERGTQTEENASTLQEAADEIENQLSNLENIS